MRLNLALYIYNLQIANEANTLQLCYGLNNLNVDIPMMQNIANEMRRKLNGEYSGY